MDVLDIEVDSNELQQFFDLEGGEAADRRQEPICSPAPEPDRKQWGTSGMECEVPHCQPLGKFPSFRKYINHWLKVHRKSIPLFKCSICLKKFSVHAKGKSHLKSHGTQRGILEVMDVPNHFYIDPGMCVPYRLGSKEERATELQKRKMEAQKKRRAQTRDLFATIPIPEEIRTNCRDEVVDMFPGDTADSNLMIKSLVDSENRKIDSVLMDETCVLPDFGTIL